MTRTFDMVLDLAAFIFTEYLHFSRTEYPIKYVSTHVGCALLRDSQCTLSIRGKYDASFEFNHIRSRPLVVPCRQFHAQPISLRRTNPRIQLLTLTQ